MSQHQTNRQSMSIAERIKELGLNNPENPTSKLPLPPPRFQRKSGDTTSNVETLTPNETTPKNFQITNNEQNEGKNKKTLPAPPVKSPPLPERTHKISPRQSTGQNSTGSVRVPSLIQADNHPIHLLQQQLMHATEVLTPYSHNTSSATTSTEDDQASYTSTASSNNSDDESNDQNTNVNAPPAIQPLAEIINAGNGAARKTLPPPPSRFSVRQPTTPGMKLPAPPIIRAKSMLPIVPSEHGATNGEPKMEIKKGLWIEYKPPEKVDDVNKDNVAKVVSEEELKLKEELNQKYSNVSAEQQAAAILIQKNYRGFRARKLVKKKKNNKYTRRRNALEILSTEKTYVECLQVLVEVYLKPLKGIANQPNPCITSKEISVIFSDIEVILNVAEAFYEKLNDRIGNENFNDKTNISDVFLSMAPYFKTYSRYCNNYDKSMNQLKKSKENMDFKSLIAQMDKDSRTTKLGLASYLILPIQRIPRYQLLLRDLIQHTEPSHPDYANLQSAEEKIREVAVHLNSAMKIIDATNELLRVQQAFIGEINFIEPHRRFKKEGALEEIPDLELSSRAPIYLHLFNDMIVLSRQRGSNFELKTKIMLAGAVLQDYVLTGAEEAENEKYIFQVRAPQGTAILRASSDKEKASWLEAIHEVLAENKRVQSSAQILVSQVPSDDSTTTFNIALQSEQQDFSLSPEECVEQLKLGATMLKYCRNARPHFRKIILSQDEEYLMWGSPNKSSHESVVALKDVKKIVLGQKTAMFQRYKNPELEGLSFSLLYKNRTLDICCKDKREYDTWVLGISHLLYQLENEGSSRISRTISQDGNGIQTPVATVQNIDLVEEQKKFKEMFQRIGDAYSWGQGARGALAHGDQNDQMEPLVIKDFLFLDVSSIECENSAAAAVMLGGELFTWGAGDMGRLGHGDEGDRIKATLVKSLQGRKIVSCKMGLNHTLALEDTGVIWAFGGNSNGQLGLGIKDTKQLKPTIVPSIRSTSNRRVVGIECGHWHSACIMSDGQMMTWGSGEDGQLGHSNKSKICAVPTLVESALVGKQVVNCSLGLWHSLAVCSDGTIYSWGNATYGQLGHGNTDECLTPTEITYFSKNKLIVTQASAGSTHSGCITKGGDIFMWGNGIYGQIGNGKKQHAYIPTRVDALAGRPAKQLACGVNHVMVLLSDGLVYSWGAGTYGRLGVKSESDIASPVQITFLADKSVRQIACGGSQSACVCAHQWVPDKDATNCMDCKALFTFIRRRHHCRYCGGIFCGTCTHKRITLLRFGHSDPVRVCDNCYTILSKR